MNKEIISIIKKALKEDIPTIDVSSHFLFDKEISLGKFIAKGEGVISGIDVCKETFKLIDPDTEFKIYKNNGESVIYGDVIAIVKGKTKSLLKSERVGLNFLQRMSGIATLTKKFVDETKGFEVKILDTRKTTPLLRILEKQAVVNGGGSNHRMNLSEMVMLKDNHIKAAGSLLEAVDLVRKHIGKTMKIEVEVDDIKKFYEALQSDADIIMLDNMSNDVMAECAKINNHKKILEASGNMTVERINGVCKTGIDTISVGALTHSYTSLDISLKF